jgi:RNA 2',3'-cyclic 3'-phosphodiesterase
MRLFFALDLNQQDKQRIAQWRAQAIGAIFKAIPVDNFHLTLSFLGNVNTAQYHALVQFANGLNTRLDGAAQAITLELDHCGLFRKPQVLYLAGHKLPERIAQLAEQLKQQALSLAIAQQQQPFLPHISLYRKANYRPDVKPVSNLSVSFSSFSLYQSISARDNATGQVQYRAIHTWPVRNI